MIYLQVGDLLRIATRVLGGPPDVRELGLLHAAAERPSATFGGEELYPGLELKAAALVHSVARSHALFDGNTRLALATLIVFLGVNGRRLSTSEDEAYDFIVELADGLLDDISEIGGRIARGSTRR